MIYYLTANNAASTLAAGISAVATSLTVATGAGALFPTPFTGAFGELNYFRLTLVRLSDGAVEIVECTARSGDVLTIERAKESTTALVFNTGDKVELRLTAGVFASMQPYLVSGQNINTVGGQSLVSLPSGDIIPILPVTIVSGTTVSAVNGNHYVLTNVAATTVTLPAAATGVIVKITVANGLTTNSVARNGATIMGSATDLTIDSVTSITLQYLNSSWRLV